jgi:hypothetical protein
MKTFFADIIPRIQEYSQKLDNITLLTNQHWVVVDEIANSKTVYIFLKKNKQSGKNILVISRNGKVEKAKWKYLDNNTLLIDLKKGESYLFRHGFFDENVLALKVDGRDEYALLASETKYDKELNSAERVLEFLSRKYLEPGQNIHLLSDKNERIFKFESDKGVLDIVIPEDFHPQKGNKVFLNGQPAPDGKYRLGVLWYEHIKDGVIVKHTMR